MIDAVSFRARIGIFNLRARAGTLLRKDSTKICNLGPSLKCFLLLAGILLFAVLCTGLSFYTGPSRHPTPKLMSDLHNNKTSSLKLKSNLGNYNTKEYKINKGEYCILSLDI